MHPRVYRHSGPGVSNVSPSLWAAKAVGFTVIASINLWTAEYLNAELFSHFWCPHFPNLQEEGEYLEHHNIYLLSSIPSQHGIWRLKSLCLPWPHWTPFRTSPRSRVCFLLLTAIAFFSHSCAVWNPTSFWTLTSLRQAHWCNVHGTCALYKCDIL